MYCKWLFTAGVDVLNKFDSKEVEHMFRKLFTAEEGKEEGAVFYYYIERDDLLLKVMDCVLKVMDFVLRMVGFVLKTAVCLEDVRVFYKQSVFDYLAANSKRTFNNGICDTLLGLDLLQRPEMLGSKMATVAICIEADEFCIQNDEF